jgi:hypothetical protein
MTHFSLTDDDVFSFHNQFWFLEAYLVGLEQRISQLIVMKHVNLKSNTSLWEIKPLSTINRPIQSKRNKNGVTKTASIMVAKESLFVIYV